MHHASPGTAIHRALNPEWHLTNDTMLLREIEFWLHGLVWRETADGHAGRNAPERIPLTYDEKVEADPSVDALPLDEMKAFLGW